ncbi:MAG: chromosome segregation protein SMC [bacterium]|nr:chromosome segregation protein SMC [bacterium]
MKLHSLDISGFKSFVDPVDLSFADGVTAIVGPNGCGKSNLSDAITWVLGEQSAKSLRGATMQDVIFNGSAKRKPLGLAEVSLTLLADPSFAEAIDGKITIGRRVFRTGESQYRLNGKVVRLKQIKDLLMDTGLGIRAYSVIEQGKIGMILSGKPQERRKLLEEAAGITRYKQRKRLAELKLEETSGNLLRLDDIVSEVERALRSLKRQASAARRYQTKEGEYHDLLKHVLLGRWSLVSERLSGFDERLATLTTDDAELTADLHRDEASLVEARELLDTLARDLAERHQEQAEVAATIEGRQEFLKGGRQRSDEVGERLLLGRRQAEERRRQTSDDRHSLGNLDERSRELLDERDEAARLVAEDDDRIAACQGRVEQAVTRLEDSRSRLAESLAAREAQRSQLQQAQVEIERRTYRRRFLDEEGSGLENKLQEAESTLAAVDEQIATHGASLEDRRGRRDELAQTLEELLRRESRTSDEVRGLESRIAGLKQRQRILIELSEEHAERRRALLEALAEAGVSEPRFLAEEASPLEGWEEVIDHFLGDLADAVVVDGDAAGALDLARRLGEGGSSGIFLRPTGAAGKPKEIDDPALRHSLSGALGLPAELAGSLPPAYLVAGDEDAARLAAEHPGVAFLSRRRLWALGGAVHVQGGEAAPGVLARESELESISEEIPACEERLAQTIQSLEELVEERTRQASKSHRLDEEISRLQRELAVAQARRQDAAARGQKLTGERQTVSTEQGEIATELTALEERRQHLGEDLEQAEREQQELDTEVTSAETAVEATREEREALRTAGAGRRGRLELLEERLESHNQEASRIRGQITYTEEQVETWNQEDTLLQRRLEELETSMAQAESDLQEALERRAETQDAVLERQDRLDVKREEIRTLEEYIGERRTSHESLRTEIEELRVERAGVRQDAEHLSVQYREEFKLALPGTLEKYPPPAIAIASAEAEPAAETEAAKLGESSEEAAESESAAEGEASAEEPAVAEVPAELVEDDVEIPAIDLAEMAELEAELARCKAILERLGPVNVLAAQEYDEQKEREGFLKLQRHDVAESVRRLQATIREINETSSVRFRETFAQVNVKFGEIFTRLFRGGEAEMRLFDEDDILETGIEIIARPPGKRSQNIMLLSGGEKALTAIALLFALFQSKPSPFCILDEVDAPLDDVNVMRFVDTLKDMASETQFLIVTHNKLTMEVAKTLYGVTMEERGVSKLVSVEIDHVQPVERAATA